MFCREAKLCFSAISTTIDKKEVTLESAVDEEDSSLLQIMKIPRLKQSKYNRPYDVVLWDTGSTNHYVRNGHATKMGFPSRRETIRVLTIGGDVKTIDGIIYRCQISDQNSNDKEFVAHGQDEVTGTLQNPLSEQQLRKMFPGNPVVHKLVGTHRVDYLLGLSNPSWQLERVTKAKGGSDLWLYQNKF